MAETTNISPVRIQLSRRKGWKLPENTVVVSRPSVFGNPWTITEAREAGYRGTDEQLRAWCSRLFRQWVTRAPNSITRMYEDKPGNLAKIGARLHELRGKNLACWCPLPAPNEPDHCHAAVLLELANAPLSDGALGRQDGSEPGNVMNQNPSLIAEGPSDAV